MTLTAYLGPMLRKVPPLETIEVFVAAARGRSFRAVARDLALSPSAVSRRIAALEAFVDTRLFDRHGPVPALSAAGRRYLDLVEPAIGAIQRATMMLSRPDAERLSVATSHSFASSWLSPRLGALQREHGIEVEVLPTRDAAVLRSGEARLAIWGGFDAPDDLVSSHLFDADVVPVSAARLSYGLRPPTCEAELPEHVLLAARTPARLWERWFALTSLPTEKLRIREFATLQLMYEATASGAGVALGIPLVAEPGLTNSRLEPCASPPRRIGESYRVYSLAKPGSRSPIERRFVEWLRGEVHVSLQTFGRIVTTRSGRDQCQPPGAA